jgi:hypothetical protein
MKSVASVFALGSVLFLASSAFAADPSSQPLTRADCNKAGMSWNEGANVCASKAEGLKAESGAKAQTAKASASSNAKGASKPKAVSKAAKPSKKVHASSKKKKHAYSKRKSSYPKRAHYKHPQQSQPVERRPFRWLFRKPNRPAGAS